MTMCTCNAQLQPHDRIEGVCAPDAKTPWFNDYTVRPLANPEAQVICDVLNANIAAERDPEDPYRDYGGEG